MELGRLLPDRLAWVCSPCSHAPDADAAPSSRKPCDRIFVMIALHTIAEFRRAARAASTKRSSGRTGDRTRCRIAAIAFGGPWHPGHDRACALFAITDYAPPEAAAPPRPRCRRAGTLEARYVQGLDANARSRSGNRPRATFEQSRTTAPALRAISSTSPTPTRSAPAGADLGEPSGRPQCLGWHTSILLGGQRRRAARGACGRHWP